jgi:hypothetical protein
MVGGKDTCAGCVNQRISKEVKSKDGSSKGSLQWRWGFTTEMGLCNRDSWVEEGCGLKKKKKKKKKEKKRGMHTWVAKRMQWEFDWGRGIRGRKGFS